MTSAKKLAANRANAAKSTGPRTGRGKSRSSGNAVRHGLEALNLGRRERAEEAERLARAICPDRSNPFRFEQAMIAAETQIFLTRVRAARVDAQRHQAADSKRGVGSPALSEAERMRRVLTELLKLERYERRALSRRKRAIRRFAALAD
jgi:hypothetical protein